MVAAVTVHMPCRPPLDGAGLLAFLRLRAVPGVEEVSATTYRRTLRLAHGTGIVELTPATDHVACSFALEDETDRDEALGLARRVPGLDADPAAIGAVLGADPLLAPLVAAAPGLRVPGATDGAELAVRAVLGQQVSVAAARTHAARLVVAHGAPLPAPDGALTHIFPTAAALAAVDPATLAMPGSRARALLGLAAALAAGTPVSVHGGDTAATDGGAATLALQPGADRADTERGLLALPGIGPWTAAYIAMRALGDRDAFLPTDLGVRHALAALGGPADAKAIIARAERWRPFRAYAVMHLWAAL